MDASADSPASKRRIFELSVFFAAIYFVQGITEPGAGIASQPIFSLFAAAFLFLWNFSPSIGVPLDYHLVDKLGFSKIFLGLLYSLSSAAAIVGATIFGKLCRKMSLRRLLHLSVAIGVMSTLAYWGLVGPRSAIALCIGNGAISMIASLATFDLAARSCPDKAEGTFFAALMSIANIGTADSAFVGGKLYDWLGLKPLILVSGLTTAACWLILPLIRIDSPPTADLDGRLREFLRPQRLSP